MVEYLVCVCNSDKSSFTHLVKNKGEFTGIFFTVALGYKERMSMVTSPEGVFLKSFSHGWRVLTWGSLDKCLLITVVLSRVRPSVTTKGELVKDGAQCFKFLKFGQILSCKQGSST